MAHCRDDFGVEAAGVGVGGEVGLEGFGAHAEGLEVGDEGGSGGGGGIVVDCYGAPEVGEREGSGFADAAGAAGYEGEVGFEVC